MRRLSSISQWPSSRTAATAWSSPRMVSGMITMRRSSAGDAGHAQRYEFRDRIVLAVAGAAVEGDERRAPDVDLAVLGEIAHRPDREIDRAVDFAEPGAAVALPASVDDGEKLQARRRTRSARGRRRTARAAPVRRRACARRPAIWRRGRRQDDRRGGQPERLERISAGSRSAGSNSGVAALSGATGPNQARPHASMPHATRARDRKAPSDAPCPGIGEALKLPRVTGSFRGR